MKNNFITQLVNEISTSMYNDFGDNFDTRRFGQQRENNFSVKNYIKARIFKNRLISSSEAARYISKAINIFKNYGEKLEVVYNLFTDDESKDLLVKLVAYRILGHRKVKLPSNNPEYFKNYSYLFDQNDAIEINYLGKKRKIFKANLADLGFPLELYVGGVQNLFVFQQYNYKNYIKAEEGDVVLDCGACYGDTALYFASLVGDTGKVIPFEFIPSNIAAFHANLNANSHLASCIELVKNPIWNKDGLPIYFKDRGPASKVAFDNFPDSEGQTETVTIDTVVEKNDIQKIDFIKMDIEGAEPYALEGAINTIKRYKPKLAIASYHSMDDFVNIPIWINNLNLGYKLFMQHATIHLEESVVFAIAD